MVKMLKASCLLLDITKEELVRMHDVVRDVTSWIASEEKKAFMVKTDTGLTNWPEEECLEQLTGISLIENNMRVLPSGLACPKLENLLLGCSESHGCCRSKKYIRDLLTKVNMLDCKGVITPMSSGKDSKLQKTVKGEMDYYIEDATH
ncbi:hypothetical protein WN943_001655 [Citrus x changshan-huyou]